MDDTTDLPTLAEAVDAVRASERSGVSRQAARERFAESFAHNPPD
jgi:hypothetical protein